MLPLQIKDVFYVAVNVIICTWHYMYIWPSWSYIVSDIAIFVLKRDVKLQQTNSWSYKINLTSTKTYVCTGHNGHNSRYKTHCPWLIDWVNVLHPTQHKIGHFEDVLPTNLLICSQSPDLLSGTCFQTNSETPTAPSLHSAITQVILLQPVLACWSALEVFSIMRNINLHFTYLTYAVLKKLNNSYDNRYKTHSNTDIMQ